MKTTPIEDFIVAEKDLDDESENDMYKLDHIEKLYEKKKVQDITQYKKELFNIVFDMSVSIQARLIAFKRLISIDPEIAFEICKNFMSLYTISKLTGISEFLKRVCMETYIDTSLKIQLAQMLYDKTTQTGFETLAHICSNFENIPIVVQIDTVKDLFWCNKYTRQAFTLLSNILDNNDLEPMFRYKTILNLENNIDFDKEYGDESEEDSNEDSDDKNNNSDEPDDIAIARFTENIKAVICSLMQRFFENKENPIEIRLLSAQYILKDKFIIDDTVRNSIETQLLDIARLEDIQYNVRADATDILLQYGKNTKDSATEVIMELGKVDQKSTLGPKTIFDDAQNAHYAEFTESFNEGIEFLSGIPILKIDEVAITYDYVYSRVMELIEEYLNPEEESKIISRIYISLNRIHMDRALYSSFRYTLATILIRVWTYMQAHDSFIEMQKRLLQELDEMSGLCSTGLAERLVNVISGFGDFNYRMTWRDQIVANVVGRMNARMRNISNTWNTPERILKILHIILSDIDIQKQTIAQYIKTKRLNTYKFPLDDSPQSIRKYNESIAKLKKKGKFPSDTDMLEAYKRKYLHTDTSIAEDFQTSVIMEVEDATNSSERIHFTTFFSETILSIREEMYEEFKHHISDEEFDLYMRNAISHYEVGKF